MKPNIALISLLLPIAAHSADSMSSADDYYSAYSIKTVIGDMPIRNVIVKRGGEGFTSYRGFQFDCSSRDFSQTGFYNSPESALAELSKTKRADNMYSSLSDKVRSKACEPEAGTNVGTSSQPLRAS